MSLEANRALIRQWVETGLNTGDLTCIADFFSPAYVFPGISGIAALTQSLTKIRSAFPDLHVRIVEIMAEGDKVMARLAYRGTHLGAFAQHSPSGKRFSWSGVAVYRIEDGKIVEEWAIWEQTFFFKLSGSF